MDNAAAWTFGIRRSPHQGSHYNRDYNLSHHQQLQSHQNLLRSIWTELKLVMEMMKINHRLGDGAFRWIGQKAHGIYRNHGP